MAGQLTNVVIGRCVWEEIRASVQNYYQTRNILVDSFWEDHVRSSNLYRIRLGEEEIGWFAIYEETILTLFWVCPEYAALAPDLFLRARNYECVKEAFVPTGDESFLALALDQYSSAEKQAFFFRYSGRAPRYNLNISLHHVDVEKDTRQLKLTGGYFDEDIRKIKSGAREEIYTAELDHVIVGFGVLEYATVVPSSVSIGMYVCEEYRQRGIACSILTHLRERVKNQGLTPISGCWYYNHNSKKSLESAGAYAVSRLLRFHF